MKTELVEELFASIVSKSPSQRKELLSAADYPKAVKEAATRLVKAYESKSQLLNENLVSDIARVDPDFFDSPEQDSELVLQSGDRVKGYVVDKLIGQGGMSMIYSAVQTEPIKLRVALKLIRPSLFTPKAVMRFFREQQAMAMVGHPNIATLYEVGATNDGHPFAAMELVNGLPITAFCQKHSLHRNQRMILFLRACDGLMHAHHHSKGQPVSVSAPSPIARTKGFAKSNRVLIGVAAALLLLTSSFYGFYSWNSSVTQLDAARQANTDSGTQIAAANDLIMRLLASDMYELTTDQFDLKLIPVYQTQYTRIKATGGPQSNEDKTVCGILAVLYAMSGNFDRADELMEQVSDDEQESDLRAVREKICSEYAATAKERLRALEGEGNSFERAEQQMISGRCYIVWNMLDDAKSLLIESIQFYDSNDPGCCESLVARNTLAKIYDQAGEDANKHTLLLETVDSFRDNEELLATPRGKIAFSKIVDSLIAVDPTKYDSLKRWVVDQEKFR